MITAIVVLAVAAAALTGLVAALVWLLERSRAAHEIDRVLLLGEQRRGDAIAERELEQTKKAAFLETENHELERRLALAEQQRDAAAEKAAHAAANSIRSAPTGDGALDEFRRRLQEPILHAAGEAGTAGADRPGDR